MDGISVDRDFARFGSKSYAINKITSLNVRSVEPFSPAIAYIMGAASFLTFMLGLTLILGDLSSGLLCFGASAGTAAIAWHGWKQSLIVEYHLYLMTASQEFQAFRSRDLDEVNALRWQIEASMAGRLP